MYYRWSNIDGASVSSNKILASDKFGRLAMISVENLKEAGIVLVPLGEVRILLFFSPIWGGRLMRIQLRFPHRPH